MVSRDSSFVEIAYPPVFNYGDKVRSKKLVKNDGTFPNKEIGELLVKKAMLATLFPLAPFCSSFYIYGVDFYERGYIVGMKAKELELLDDDLS